MTPGAEIKIERLVETYEVTEDMLVHNLSDGYTAQSRPGSIFYQLPEDRLPELTPKEAYLERIYSAGYTHDNSDHSTHPALLAGAGLAGGALLGAGLKKLYDKKKENK